MNPPRCTTKRRINALSIAQMMVAMIEDGMTVYELAEACGLSVFTTRHYVLALHREGGCYIAHWEQDKRSRYTTPAYMLGAKKDAKKPTSTNAERARVYRAKKAQAQMLGLTP